MGIKRYRADLNNTIVNAFKSDFSTRATGSNMGQADVLETYSIYGRVTTSSQELSRILVQFPVTDISSDRTAGVIPASGSVSYYLRMFDAEHSTTTPRSYTLTVNPISQSWQEGLGLDLENYTDTRGNNVGSNWLSASQTQGWTNNAGTQLIGGSIITSSGDYLYEQSFDTGFEDLEIEITPLVERWIAGDINNYGVLVKLSSSFEASASLAYANEDTNVIENDGGATTSYYTKRLFGRGTQFFFKRPVIEARWNSSEKDDRGNFYYSSSLASGEDNLNTLYFYNYVRGRLANIPAIGTTGSILVSLYSGSADDTAPSGSKLILHDGNVNVTGGFVSTGIYSCSIAVTAATTPLSTLYDVWHSGSVEYFTGSIEPESFLASNTVSKPVYFLNITNLQSKYRSDQTARFNLFVREKNWNPNVYTKVKATIPSITIESASYRVYRTLDGLEAVPYGTGSDLHTVLSHDVSGNYYDFDMNLLQPGFEYAFRFSFYDSALNSWQEQRETFKFRVEEYEY
jgi:hypothetical protein